MEITNEMLSEEKANNWIMWTHVFLIADGALQTAYRNLSDDKAKTVFRNIHIALKDVNGNFKKVAEAILAGKEIPTVSLPPADIPEWEEKTMKDAVVEMLTGAVDIIIGKLSAYESSEPIQMVLQSLAGLATALSQFKSL